MDLTINISEDASNQHLQCITIWEREREREMWKHMHALHTTVHMLHLTTKPDTYSLNGLTIIIIIHARESICPWGLSISINACSLLYECNTRASSERTRRLCMALPRFSNKYVCEFWVSLPTMCYIWATSCPLHVTLLNEKYLDITSTWTMHISPRASSYSNVDHLCHQNKI